jgi:cytoskeleton protein RodZ
VTNDDLRSLGEMLRQARESQAYSLEEVEAQTRIRVKYLQALENGDFSVLPSATHAKGFLRNYAQFLHLDANAVVAQFGDLIGEQSGPVTTVTAPPSPQVPSPAAPSPTPAPPRPYPAPPPQGEAAPPYPGIPQPQPSPYPARQSTHVGPGQRVGPSMPSGLSAPPAAQPIVAEPQQPTRPTRIWRSPIFTLVVLVAGFAAIIWWATSKLSTISVEDIMPTEQGSRLLEEFAASATVEPSPTFKPTSTEAPFAGPQVFERVLLTIAVKQRTWTRIVVDGETVFEGQAMPGTVLQYEGRQSILVRTGNGAGLNVTYNGQDLGPLGERGRVVERIFTVSGQITPTPTSTVTTTPTQVPTATPRTTRGSGE